MSVCNHTSIALYTSAAVGAGVVVVSELEVEFELASREVSLCGTYRSSTTGSSGFETNAVLVAQMSIVESTKIPTAASRFLSLYNKFITQLKLYPLADNWVWRELNTLLPPKLM